MGNLRLRASPSHPPIAKHALADLVGPDWCSLSPAIQARFAPRAARAIYFGEGVFAANWFGRLCALAGACFGRPLPLRTGHASVDIEVAPGPGGEVWKRLYRFGPAAEVVASTKHTAGAWLEERAGPVVMRLRVFVADRMLVFESVDFRFRGLGRDWPIPALFTPGRLRVTHEDRGEDQFIFTLEARHPLFGVTLHQRCHMHVAGAAR
jgi:hypothetical protein